MRSPPAPAATDPLHYTTTNTAVPGTSKSKTLIYAVGVAAIVASGAIAGALVKIAQQNSKAQAKQDENRQEEAAASTATATATAVDYHKAIESLETRRAHLIAEKVQYERKIFTLREAQRRKKMNADEEERVRKGEASVVAVGKAQRSGVLGEGLNEVDVRR